MFKNPHYGIAHGLLRSLIQKSEMGAVEDRVVAAIHARFETLPKRCKPRMSADGGKEWVPLAGVVLVRGDDGLWAPSYWGAELIPND